MSKKFESHDITFLAAAADKRNRKNMLRVFRKNLGGFVNASKKLQTDFLVAKEVIACQ